MKCLYLLNPILIEALPKAVARLKYRWLNAELCSKLALGEEWGFDFPFIAIDRNTCVVLYSVYCLEILQTSLNVLF